MRTDYKFWYIKRDDTGFITEAAVRFYEGEYQMINGEKKYVRTKRLETVNELKHLAKDGKLKGVTEQTGEQCVFYNQEDFGQIQTDGELRSYLNQELAKDKSREPIEEQKWQP
jgi:hypothetical protein